MIERMSKQANNFTSFFRGEVKPFKVSPSGQLCNVIHICDLDIIGSERRKSCQSNIRAVCLYSEVLCRWAVFALENVYS